MRETYYMVDIETTGTNKETDDILEIAMVPVQFLDGYWVPTGSTFHRKLFSDRQPETQFAKKHMAKLYEECNALNPNDHGIISTYTHIRAYLHQNAHTDVIHQECKYFMGWNASNFDLEFLFKKNLMRPSYYVEIDGKEVLKGDAHYRVYEQTGSIEFLVDVTGMDRKLLLSLAEAMIPADVKLTLPEGKQHDALYDCYSQINMMNGLIALGRSGFKLPGMTV